MQDFCFNTMQNVSIAVTKCNSIADFMQNVYNFDKVQLRFVVIVVKFRMNILQQLLSCHYTADLMRRLRQWVEVQKANVGQRTAIDDLLERTIAEEFTDKFWIQIFRMTGDTLTELCDAIKAESCSETSPLFTFSLDSELFT